MAPKLPSETGAAMISRWLCLPGVFLSVLCSWTVSAQESGPTDPSTYSTVLVPVNRYFASDPLKGANGSRWVTLMQVYNLHSGDVLLNQGGPVCSLPGGCPTESGFAAIPGNFLGDLEAESFTGIEGSLQHVESRYLDRVRFQLRIFDLSRTDQNLGTEVPVVRDTNFLRGRSAILSIPVSGEARVAVRIYDPSGGVVGERFRLRAFAELTPELLFEQDLEMTVFPSPTDPNFPPFPGYAAVFGVEQRPELDGHDRVRFEIQPPDDAVKYWWMVSVTNNATQMVTIVSPQ